MKHKSKLIFLLSFLCNIEQKIKKIQYSGKFKILNLFDYEKSKMNDLSRWQNKMSIKSCLLKAKKGHNQILAYLVIYFMQIIHSVNHKKINFVFVWNIFQTTIQQTYDVCKHLNLTFKTSTFFDSFVIGMLKNQKHLIKYN